MLIINNTTQDQLCLFSINQSLKDKPTFDLYLYGVEKGGGCYRMDAGFITTYAISVYHH